MRRLLLSLGGGLLTLLLACGSWAEERVVHFYQVNALTGQAGSYGTRSIHGAELAAKHLNDAGGFPDTCGNQYTIKLSNCKFGDQPVSSLDSSSRPLIMKSIK